MNDSLTADLTDRGGVKRRLARAGVRPSKRLGQNFLVDRHALKAIEKEITEIGPEWVVEIGAGLGTITRILAHSARRTIAIEIDERLVGEIRRTLGEGTSVEIIQGDVLSFDFARIGGGKGLVVGSIPYRISTPIIRHLVRNRPFIDKAILITQREVAEKIMRSPGRGGTSLGVFVQAYADVAPIMNLGRESFFPPPDVDSTMWVISFREVPKFTAEEGSFFSLVREIYGRRRKMIRSVLRVLLPPGEVEAVLRRAGIDGRIRGETLDLAGLDRLALAMEETEKEGGTEVSLDTGPTGG